MATVTFIDFGGTVRVVDASVGMSLADTALHHRIPGIEADCGGHCACGTCHVYVDESWIDKLAPIEELERNMVELALDVRPNSRLACQLKITEALDGLVVQTPERQYL